MDTSEISVIFQVFLTVDGVHTLYQIGVKTLTNYSMSSRKPKPKEKPVLTEESLKGASSVLLTAVEGTEGGGRAADDNRLLDLVHNRPP